MELTFGDNSMQFSIVIRYGPIRTLSFDWICYSINPSISK